MRRLSHMPYLFLAPFFTAFSLFFVAPVAYSLYLSLLVRQRRVGAPPLEVFGGLTNYIHALGDRDFLTSFGNVFFFGVIQIPIMLGLATVFALILDEGLGNRLSRFFRTVFYLPYTIPSVVGGLLWSYLYSRNLSPLNYLLREMGSAPINLLDSRLLLFAVGNIITWTWTGYNAITLFTSLQSQPRDLYEAARVDGATRMDLIRYIKLPLLRPALLLTFIFSLIGTSQIFGEAFILKPVTYVPQNITPNTYIYGVASLNGNYSYAAALALVLALVTFVGSSAFLRLATRSNES